VNGGWESLDAEAYQALFFHSVDGVMFTDPTGGLILAANPAGCALLGMTEAEICTLGRAGVIDPADGDRWAERIAERARTGSFRGELSFRRADGSTFPAEVTSQMFTDRAGATRSCIIVRDITDRKRLEAELWELALVDDLTGLHNRRAFNLLAEQAVKEAVRAKRPVFGVFVDVDHLKAINDHHGHAAGDQALRLVAEALRAACRESDIVGRLSGDEFAIVLAEAHELDGLEGRLRCSLADKARTVPYALSVSVGVATCPAGDVCDLDELFHQADRAMYAEKMSQRHR
jgi:diguanylate cyclase (GGDEF)-like protein/PAS domain S-box-containing protein